VRRGVNGFGVAIRFGAISHRRWSARNELARAAKTKRARTGNRGRRRTSTDRKLSDFRQFTTLRMATRAKGLQIPNAQSRFCAQAKPTQQSVSSRLLSERRLSARVSRTNQAMAGARSCKALSRAG
jgi:hypothetical protein